MFYRASEMQTVFCNSLQNRVNITQNTRTLIGESMQISKIWRFEQLEQTIYALKMFVAEGLLESKLCLYTSRVYKSMLLTKIKTRLHDISPVETVMNLWLISLVSSISFANGW